MIAGGSTPPAGAPPGRPGDPGDEPVDERPWLVAGLGNPGPAYAGTRHNVGYLVVDLLAERLRTPWRRHRTGRADVAEGRLGAPGSPAGARRVLLAKARALMNESGGALAAVAAYSSIGPDRVVAVHDELDLDFGRLRVKVGGGDNGHNGLRSLRRSLHTGDFARVRFGIGRPPGRQDPADFVLSSWGARERAELGVQVGTAADAVQSLILRDLTLTQSDFHRP